MSLINQMLKDLEKRRSRDLETSETLTRNITWENHPRGGGVHWRMLSMVSLLIVLSAVVAYLLWERWQQPATAVTASKPALTKKIASADTKPSKPKVTTAPVITPNETAKQEVHSQVTTKEEVVVNRVERPIDVEAEDSMPAAAIEKTERPLTAEQRAEVSYQEAFSALQKGSQRQGEIKLRAALEQYPQHVKAREMLAGVYIKAGRYVEAAELLRLGIHLVPGYTLFAKLYARVLLEQNNPKQAIQVLEQQQPAVEADPDYHALLAATYQRVNEHQKAVDVYLKVVKVQPLAGVWWLGLAISLEKSGKNKEALEAYQRAQETGTLNAGLTKFSNNRVSALKEIGFPN